MDPQIANFFTNLTSDMLAFLLAWKLIEDRFQEAFDRDIDGALATIDFSQYGDLAYLDQTKINAAFAAYQAVKATMDANTRQNWTRFYGIIR